MPVLKTSLKKNDFQEGKLLRADVDGKSMVYNKHKKVNSMLWIQYVHTNEDRWRRAHWMITI